MSRDRGTAVALRRPASRHEALRARADLDATVARIVRAIPRGRVLSYARVAVLAGLPGRARLVGKVMGRIGAGVPWWRVLRSDRTLADEVREEQRRRLRREGVEVPDGGRVPRAAMLLLGEMVGRLEARGAMGGPECRSDSSRGRPSTGRRATSATPPTRRTASSSRRTGSA